MDYYTASDKAILKELGQRLRALRLSRNITQESLANQTLLSIGTIKSMEAGKGKLATLVAILRELNTLDQLDQFIPPITISPIKLAETQTKRTYMRVRARDTMQKRNEK